MEMKPVIKIKLDEGAWLPAKAHEWVNGVPGDAGYDVKVLRAEAERIAPAPGCRIGWVRVKLDTGIHVQPPTGYRIMAVPNSRVTKTGFILPNSPGTIDANYRGSIRFCYLYPFCVNEAPRRSEQRTAGIVPPLHASKDTGIDSDYAKAAMYALAFWQPGTVCGQLIVVPDYDSVVQVCDELDDTARGDGGFGSTQDGKETGNEK